MSDMSQIARPYAQAAFDFAHEQGTLAEWSDQLALLAAVAADDGLQDVVSDPRVSGDSLESLFSGVAGDKMTAEAGNLLKLLVKNQRLLALPEISSQFEALKTEAEQVIEATLVTASPVDDGQKEAVAASLSKRLGQEVRLNSEVDESLIGGAVVRAGDWVVDASVRAQLGQLISVIES